MYIEALLNQKGGVGKTATAVNVAGALAELGRDVLLVDLDPQGHLSDALKVEPAPDGEHAPNLANVLTDRVSLGAADLAVTHSTPAGRLDVIPTCLDMFTLSRRLDQMRARELRLARLLESLRGYDYVLLDCPPALDILSENALVAADGILIPVEAEDSTLRALRLLLGQISSVEADIRDRRLNLDGMVLSRLRYVGRNLPAIAVSTIAELREVPIPILGELPLGVAVTEAWRTGRTVVDYAPSSEHAATYRAIAKTLDAAYGDGAK